MKTRENKRSPVAAICSALGTALLIILILACIPFTVPKILGYQAYTVVSGSMEPEIPTGSLVYIKETKPQEIQLKDVIAYYGGRDTNVIITHRVVENSTAKRQFITKGDANRTKDMNPVAYSNVIGRVELTIPKLGVIAQVLTSFAGKVACVCMIGAALLLHWLAALLDRCRD